MPAITKQETRIKLQFVANTDHSIHAGLVAVEAMARRFGLAVTAPIPYEGLPDVAADFDLAALQADILDSQRSGQNHRDFSRRAMQAGVQGYFAFLRGKRVTYFGRHGDQPTEWFPG